jgi:hypothetical protein
MDRPSFFDGRGRFAGAIATCLILAALARPFPAQFKFRHGGDAVRYLSWSKLVAEKGITVFPSLLREYRTKWVGFPPPTRSFYLALIAGIMKVWRSPGDEFHPLVLVSWLSGVLSLLPIVYWLRRRAPKEVIILSLLFMASSPVPRAVAHFPLPDTLHCFLNLWVFALTAEWLAAPRRSISIWLGVTSLLMVLTRETGLFGLFGAAGMVALDWSETKKLKWEPLIAMLAGCLASLVITLFIAGGFGLLWAFIVDYVKGAMLTTGSLPFVSGPPYTYLVAFMIVSPALLMTFVAAIGPLWSRADWRAWFRPVLIATIIVLVTQSFFPKTLRYMLTVDAGFRVVCAAAVWALWQRSRRAGIALLVTLLIFDIAIHAPLFLFDQMYDPTVWDMARHLRMIPFNM